MATIRSRTRRAARVPLVLYRARLGHLLGESFLLLEHVGRVTGRRRRTVLEVVGRLPDGGYVVASGYGQRADWYRNLRALPEVRVSVGRRRDVPAIARLLERGEAEAVWAAYRAAHPWRWRMVKPVLSRTVGQDHAELLDAVPLVALHLDGSTAGRTLP